MRFSFIVITALALSLSVSLGSAVHAEEHDLLPGEDPAEHCLKYSDPVVFATRGIKVFVAGSGQKISEFDGLRAQARTLGFATAVYIERSKHLNYHGSTEELLTDFASMVMLLNAKYIPNEFRVLAYSAGAITAWSYVNSGLPSTKFVDEVALTGLVLSVERFLTSESFLRLYEIQNHADKSAGAALAESMPFFIQIKRRGRRRIHGLTFERNLYFARNYSEMLRNNLERGFRDAREGLVIRVIHGLPSLDPNIEPEDLLFLHSLTLNTAATVHLEPLASPYGDHFVFDHWDKLAELMTKIPDPLDPLQFPFPAHMRACHLMLDSLATIQQALNGGGPSSNPHDQLVAKMLLFRPFADYVKFFHGRP